MLPRRSESRRLIRAASARLGRLACETSLLGKGLTRHKISDSWRGRAWLRIQCGNHRKLERGAASGSLHRLVRCFVAGHWLSEAQDTRGGCEAQPKRATTKSGHGY